MLLEYQLTCANTSGLGTTLIQYSKHMAIASKVLTPVGKFYANIEKKILTCVFGAELVHMYVYGFQFMVESCHNLLEQLQKKNLANAFIFRVIM